MTGFKIGDRVWVGCFETRKVSKECPVCYGHKEVTLRLGNGDEVLLPCDYCGHGWQDPTGFVTEYTRKTDAYPSIVESITSTVSAEGTTYRYYFTGGAFVDGDKACATEEEALAKAQELAESYQRDEDTRVYHLKKNLTKSFAWNAGYHMRQAAECRRRAEEHDRKAVLCKARIPAKKEKEL